MLAVNPYFNTHFFSFFAVLLQRLWGFLTGDLRAEELVSDEIQLIVLAGVAISSALVGCFLVLRRTTMLANSLSHTILLGIVITYLVTRQTGFALGDHPGQLDIQLMLIASVISGVATAFLTEFLTKTVHLQSDASTGLVFTTLFAIGIVLVTLYTRNAHIGAEVVMGNVDALHRDDCRLVGFILLFNLALIGLLYRGYVITTFDPQLAVALGFSSLLLNYALMIQVSVTCVGAFRAVGVLMVLALITAPALTARRLTHHLNKMLVISAGIGAGASLVGVALSRHLLTVYGLALTTAGLVVCTLVVFFALSIIPWSRFFTRQAKTVITTELTEKQATPRRRR